MGEEGDAPPVGGLYYFPQFEPAPGSGSTAFLKAHRSSVAFQQFGRHRPKPRDDLIAGIDNRRSVEIGAGRSGGGGSVRHLSRARGHNSHCIGTYTQSLGRNLQNLGIEALPHLRPAVIDLYAAIAIHQHQSARLVVECRGK